MKIMLPQGSQFLRGLQSTSYSSTVVSTKKQNAPIVELQVGCSPKKVFSFFVEATSALKIKQRDF